MDSILRDEVGDGRVLLEPVAAVNGTLGVCCSWPRSSTSLLPVCSVLAGFPTLESCLLLVSYPSSVIKPTLPHALGWLSSRGVGPMGGSLQLHFFSKMLTGKTQNLKHSAEVQKGRQPTPGFQEKLRE